MTTKNQAVAESPAPNVPAHLQHGKKATLGNLDKTDLIIPRLKLLAAVSPEVEEFEAAKAGCFWHSIAGESLGKEVRIVPIVIRKSYVLWAPRGDTRGILARANDAVHWDKPTEEFKVKPKNSPKEQLWKLAETVTKSGLDKFGTSIAEDPNSPPAATLTYNMLAYLPDHPDLSPVVILNARSSVKKAKLLISKIELRPVDHYDQIYNMSSIQEQKDGETYYNYNYTSDGYTDAEQHEITAALYARFSEADFKASDEQDDTDEPETGNVGGTTGNKF